VVEAVVEEEVLTVVALVIQALPIMEDMVDMDMEDMATGVLLVMINVMVIRHVWLTAIVNLLQLELS
jgi:hypothetical protein